MILMNLVTPKAGAFVQQTLSVVLEIHNLVNANEPWWQCSKTFLSAIYELNKLERLSLASFSNPI
jgi:hypothetical protein